MRGGWLSLALRANRVFLRKYRLKLWEAASLCRSSIAFYVTSQLLYHSSAVGKFGDQISKSNAKEWRLWSEAGLSNCYQNLWCLVSIKNCLSLIPPSPFFWRKIVQTGSTYRVTCNTTPWSKVRERNRRASRYRYTYLPKHEHWRTLVPWKYSTHDPCNDQIWWNAASCTTFAFGRVNLPRFSVPRTKRVLLDCQLPRTSQYVPVIRERIRVCVNCRPIDMQVCSRDHGIKMRNSWLWTIIRVESCLRDTSCCSHVGQGKPGSLPDQTDPSSMTLPTKQTDYQI